MEDAGAVSWIAVIVSTILSFLLGWLWYSPKMFGTKWAQGVGVQLGEASDMPPQAMVFQLLGIFFLALVIGLTAASGGIFTALAAIAAVAFILLANGCFARKSRYAIMTEASYVVAIGALMILCQALF